jgi:hypothetical protein
MCEVIQKSAKRNKWISSDLSNLRDLKGSGKTPAFILRYQI